MGIDISPFARGMLEASAISAVFPETVRNFLANPLLGIIGIAREAASAMTEFIKGGVAGAASMEQAAVSFEVMLGSADKAKTLLKDLSDFAASTPFELPELVGATRKLVAFGVEQQNVLKVLQQVGDVSAGISAPIGEIAEIYGKARVQGRLMMEDINQLTGRGIPIIQEFAKQFGVAESAIRKMVEQGKVNFSNLDLAFASLTGSGGKFASLMEKQSATLSGLWSTLKDTLGQSARDIATTLLDGLNVKELVKSFTSGIGAIMQALAPVGQAIMSGIGAAMQFVGPLFEGLLPLVKGLADIVGSVLTPVFNALAPVLKIVGDALKFIFEIIGKVLSTIGGLVRGVTDFFGITTPAAESGAAAPGGAGAGGTTVNVKEISVQPIDLNDATSQIAQKIKAPLQAGVRKEVLKLDAAGQTVLVQRSL